MVSVAQSRCGPQPAPVGPSLGPAHGTIDAANPVDPLYALSVFKLSGANSKS
jgi:hypothetical protein